MLIFSGKQVILYKVTKGKCAMYVYIIGAVIAYLIGGISPSYIIASLKKKDIRSNGSGNLGASNTTILLGWKWGVLVGVIDILKAFIPITVAKYVFSDLTYLPYVIAVCVVLGHIFPIYLKFKGGKGTATYFGSMLGISFIAFAVIGLLFLIVTFATDYIVVGTYTVICLFPIYLLIFSSVIAMGILLVASFTVAFKHRENIKRIIRKEEIGLRAAFSGKHKL